MICSEEMCTGCSACCDCCPTKCITMKENKLGYIYPSIEINNCIHCKKCISVCPVNNERKMRSPVSALAAWSLDTNIRSASSSGGIAYIFSKFIIQEMGGVAYGSAICKDLIVRHIRVDTIEDLEKLRGSKYVHSQTDGIFLKVKTDLQKDIMVIFIGTPCQIAGLKNFLAYDYANLVTIDLICHGVPSSKMLIENLSNYLNFIPFDGYSFRDQRGFNLNLIKDKKIVKHIPMEEDLYYLGFMKSLFYRYNCYQCPYATEKRVSDITIGDFWGLDKDVEFKFSVKDGISVILPITEKGISLIDNCRNYLFLQERNLYEAVKGNAQLRHPSIKHHNNEKFRLLYLKYGFKKAAEQSLKKEIAEYKIKKYIRKFIKNKT